MIETAVTRVVYEGDGVTTSFPFDFPALSKDDIVVVVADESHNETTLTANYFVDLEGKRVLYPGYEPGNEPAESERPPILKSGERIAIYRNTKASQMSALGDKYPFDVVEKSLDKITMILQEQKDGLNMVVRFPATELSKGDVYIPAPVPRHALVWNDTGTNLTNAPMPTDAVEQAKQAAQSAADAATAADRAETNAAKFAEEAKTHADKIAQYDPKALIAQAHHYIQRNTAYNVGDVLTSPNLPYNTIIVVTQAGTTGADEPDWDSIKNNMGG